MEARESNRRGSAKGLGIAILVAGSAVMGGCAAQTDETRDMTVDTLLGASLEPATAEQLDALSSILAFEQEPELADLVTPEQRDHVLTILDRAGMNTANADFHVFRGEARVRIDDVNYRVSDVLAPGGAFADELTEKGYRVSANPPVGTAWSNDIRLIIGYGLDPVLGIFFFGGAGQEWSNATYGSQTAANLDIAGNNTGANGATITIHAIPPELWSQTPCFILDYACIDVDDFPSGTRPARNIYIISSGGICGAWTLETLYLVGLHELGHAVGLTHPAASGSTHVSGTASGTEYSTVMQRWGCQPTVFNLTADDRDTITTLY